jgi:hypothetical protein
MTTGLILQPVYGPCPIAVSLTATLNRELGLVRQTWDVGWEMEEVEVWALGRSFLALCLV